MKVLLVKMSSLGDVIHTFPAVTDALRHIPEVQFDWLVEGDFADLVQHHPAVRNVIHANLRQWRKQPLKTLFSGTWHRFKKSIKAQHYDVVIDAQGLLKSTLITRMANGPTWGLDKHSAREPLSAFFIQHPVFVHKQQHAVERTRQLFAQALGYDYSLEDLAYGLSLPAKTASAAKRIMLCHGTTWHNKHWPEAHWRALAEQLVEKGWQVMLPHGSEAELARAQRIGQGLKQTTVLPKLPVLELMHYMATSVDAFVAGDTGLAHLAAAVGLPGVGLFGPTDPELTGARPDVENLSAWMDCKCRLSKHCQYVENDSDIGAACMASLNPNQVKDALVKQLGEK